MAREFDYLVYIGRFQPFHNGHLAVLLRALAQANTVVVVLGSGCRARNIKNPFSDGEREQMIIASVRDVCAQDAARVAFRAVRDYYDNARWVAAVKRAVGEVTLQQDARLGIIGHVKDDSSYYLHEFPEWRLVQQDNHAGLCATDLRRSVFAPDGDAAWNVSAAAVPQAVLRFLQEFRQRPAFADLANEFAAIEQYRASWASAPYPPIFVTVDAVVRCAEHVLLVRRGAHPGRGQWALPGGFLETSETLQEGAIRELREETGLAIDPEALRRAIAGWATFDHPNRSVRGRVISHAFFFDLVGDERPDVAGGDDAAEARWFPISSLCGMETILFEDHLCIMDRFLKLY